MARPIASEPSRPSGSDRNPIIRPGIQPPFADDTFRQPSDHHGRRRLPQQREATLLPDRPIRSSPGNASDQFDHDLVPGHAIPYPMHTRPVEGPVSGTTPSQGERREGEQEQRGQQRPTEPIRCHPVQDGIIVHVIHDLDGRSPRHQGLGRPRAPTVSVLSGPSVARPMQVFRVQGTFPNGPNRQPFTFDVVADDEVEARHRVYSNLGSRHRAPRRSIEIATVESIDPSSSSTPEVLHAFRDGADASTAAEEE